jgi:hypothetical protein
VIDFHLWYQKTILHEHWKLIREQRLKLTAHNTISDDECMQIWLDSDMTNIKFVTDAVNMAEQSHTNGLMYAKGGAKMTSFTQPLDVGASFKCKKEFWCYVERQIFGLC